MFCRLQASEKTAVLEFHTEIQDWYCPIPLINSEVSMPLLCSFSWHFVQGYQRLPGLLSGMATFVAVSVVISSRHLVA